MDTDDKASAELVTTEPHAMAAPEQDQTARLMELALQQGVDGVAALERLVAMQERKEAQEAAREFAAALARAQGAIGSIPHDQRGDKSTYASLEQLAAHCRQALSDNGLSYRFTSQTETEPWTVTFHLQHAAGHAAETTCRAPKGPTKVKRRDGGVLEVSERDILSGALKTGRRLAMSLGLAIATGDAREPEPEPEAITAEQVSALLALVEDTGTKLPGFLRWLGVDHLDTLPAHRYEEAIKMLTSKRARKVEEGEA